MRAGRIKPAVSLVRRKRRTRQHVIADLSANYVERLVLLRGHSAELVRRDYGLDMLIFFHDRQGYLLDGHVSIQLKATDHARYLDRGRYVAVRVDWRDLHSWSSRLEPVMLVLYDSSRDCAYWKYVQISDEALDVLDNAPPQRTVTMRIPTDHQMTLHGIDRFRAYNRQLVRRLAGGARYERGQSKVP